MGKPNLGTALSSTFGAAIAVLDKAPSVVERLSATASTAMNAVDKTILAADAYATRMHLAALEGLKESLDDLGGIQEYQKLIDLQKSINQL